MQNENDTSRIFSADVLFFDCEATGLNPAENQIIEIGIVSGLDDVVALRRAKPRRSLPPRIVELTGITDLDLTHEPPEKELIEHIHPLLTASRALGGYFLHLDMEYLRCAYERAGMSQQFMTIAQKPLLCAKTLARRLVPDIGIDFSLPQLCKHLGLPTLSNHRAADDALMSLQAIRALAERCPLESIEQLISFQGKIVESPWEIPGSPAEDRLAARKRWLDFVASPDVQ